MSKGAGHAILARPAARAACAGSAVPDRMGAEGEAMEAVEQTDIPGVPCRRGKVRDVYDLGDRLVLVATDRISAFDAVLPTPIPGKGRVLTALSLFWFDLLGVDN